MRALWSDRQNCSHNVSQKVKPKKALARVSKRAWGLRQEGVGEGLGEEVGKGLAKGWRKVGERLAKGWRRVGEGLA